jgi:uncharacterized protein
MTATTLADFRTEYNATTSSRLEPVAPSERIEALDLLRGWAMFGVLWSNLNDWYGTAEPVTRADSVLDFMHQWFLESRFVTLLCLLFGIGFAIQLTRAAERGAEVRDVYLRRSTTLLAFGLVHALLIWNGDILIMYALASFALLLFRNASPRRQLLWGIGFIVVGQEVMWRLRFLAGLRYAVPMAWGDQIYAHGTLAQIHHQRVTDVWHWWAYFGLTDYWNTVGLFLLGAWAFRSGLVGRVIANRRTALRFMGACAAVALVGVAVMKFGEDLWPPLKTPSMDPWSWTFWSPRRLVLTALNQTETAEGLVYASLLLLAFQTSLGSRLLKPVAAVGRMALTTYLTQSIVCTLLFYGYGLGWWGRVGFTGMFAIAVSLFAVQLVVSTRWLRRTRFGPVEWLWRTATYGRAPSMRA